MIWRNLAAFQVGWLACVLGAGLGHPAAGPAVVAALVALHLGLSPRPWGEVALLVVAGGVGTAAEALQVRLGHLAFADGGPHLARVPLWMTALWINFGTTLGGCLRWLQRRPALAAAIGGVAGPAAYLGGERLGALQLGEPRVTAIVAVAIVYLVATPGLALSARAILSAEAEEATS